MMLLKRILFPITILTNTQACSVSINPNAATNLILRIANDPNSGNQYTTFSDNAETSDFAQHFNVGGTCSGSVKYKFEVATSDSYPPNNVFYTKDLVGTLDIQVPDETIPQAIITRNLYWDTFKLKVSAVNPADEQTYCEVEITYKPTGSSSAEACVTPGSYFDGVASQWIAHLGTNLSPQMNSDINYASNANNLMFCGNTGTFGAYTIAGCQVDTLQNDLFFEMTDLPAPTNYFTLSPFTSTCLETLTTAPQYTLFGQINDPNLNLQDVTNVPGFTFDQTTLDLSIQPMLSPQDTAAMMPYNLRLTHDASGTQSDIFYLNGCSLQEPASFGTAAGYEFIFNELIGSSSFTIDSYTNEFAEPVACVSSLVYSWEFPIAGIFTEDITNPLKINFDTTLLDAINLDTQLTLLIKVSRSNNPSNILKQKEIKVTVLGECKGNLSGLQFQTEGLQFGSQPPTDHLVWHTYYTSYTISVLPTSHNTATCGEETWDSTITFVDPADVAQNFLTFSATNRQITILPQQILSAYLPAHTTEFCLSATNYYQAQASICYKILIVDCAQHLDATVEADQIKWINGENMQQFDNGLQILIPHPSPTLFQNCWQAQTVTIDDMSTNERHYVLEGQTNLVQSSLPWIYYTNDSTKITIQLYFDNLSSEQEKQVAGSYVIQLKWEIFTRSIPLYLCFADESDSTLFYGEDQRLIFSKQEQNLTFDILLGSIPVYPSNQVQCPQILATELSDNNCGDCDDSQAQYILPTLPQDLWTQKLTFTLATAIEPTIQIVRVFQNNDYNQIYTVITITISIIDCPIGMSITQPSVPSLNPPTAISGLHTPYLDNYLGLPMYQFNHNVEISESYIFESFTTFCQQVNKPLEDAITYEIKAIHDGSQDVILTNKLNIVMNPQNKLRQIDFSAYNGVDYCHDNSLNCVLVVVIEGKFNTVITSETSIGFSLYRCDSFPSKVSNLVPPNVIMFTLQDYIFTVKNTDLTANLSCQPQVVGVHVSSHSLVDSDIIQPIDNQFSFLHDFKNKACETSAQQLSCVEASFKIKSDTPIQFDIAYISKYQFQDSSFQTQFSLLYKTIPFQIDVQCWVWQLKKQIGFAYEQEEVILEKIGDSIEFKVPSFDQVTNCNLPIEMVPVIIYLTEEMKASEVDQDLIYEIADSQTVQVPSFLSFDSDSEKYTIMHDNAQLMQKVYCIAFVAEVINSVAPSDPIAPTSERTRNFYGPMTVKFSPLISSKSSDQIAQENNQAPYAYDLRSEVEVVVGLSQRVYIGNFRDPEGQDVYLKDWRNSEQNLEASYWISYDNSTFSQSQNGQGLNLEFTFNPSSIISNKNDFEIEIEVADKQLNGNFDSQKVSSFKFFVKIQESIKQVEDHLEESQLDDPQSQDQSNKTTNEQENEQNGNKLNESLPEKLPSLNEFIELIEELDALEKFEFEKTFIGKQFSSYNFESEMRVQISQPVNSYGTFEIQFSREIKLPQIYDSWSSQNEGKGKLNVVYLPSPETANIAEETSSKKLKVHTVDWFVSQTETYSSQPSIRQLQSLKNKGSVAAYAEVSEIQIQVNFTDTDLISTGTSQLDKVWIELDPSIFDNDPFVQKLVSDKPLRFAHEIPKQLSWNEKEFVNGLKKGIVGGIQTLIASNILLSFSMSFLMQQLWGVINTLQMIVLTVLFSVMMPTNCSIVMIEIMKTVNFDLLNTEGLVVFIFGFKDTVPFNKTFYEAGFQGSNFLIESGLLLFVVIAFTLFVITRYILKKIYPRRKKRNFLVNFFTKPINFRLAILRFILETTVELGLVSFICALRISQQNFNTFQNCVSSIANFVFMAILLIAPLYVVYLVRQYYKDTKSKYSKLLYKEMWSDLNSKDPHALCYSLVFLSRRLLMVIVLTTLPQQRNIQITIQLWSTLYSMCYIAYVRPYLSYRQNVVEIINEFLVLIASYHLFCFTEWISDADRRYNMGYSLIGCVLFNFAFNLANMLQLTCSQALSQSKRKFLKYKNKKHLVKKEVESGKNGQLYGVKESQFEFKEVRMTSSAQNDSMIAAIENLESIPEIPKLLNPLVYDKPLEDEFFEDKNIQTSKNNREKKNTTRQLFISQKLHQKMPLEKFQPQVEDMKKNGFQKKIISPIQIIKEPVSYPFNGNLDPYLFAMDSQKRAEIRAVIDIQKTEETSDDEEDNESIYLDYKKRNNRQIVDEGFESERKLSPSATPKDIINVKHTKDSSSLIQESDKLQKNIDEMQEQINRLYQIQSKNIQKFEKVNSKIRNVELKKEN